MCKGWALQVVQRRPDTAGAPGSWTRRGLQGTPWGGLETRSPLPGNVGARRRPDPGQSVGPRKEDPEHAGCGPRVVNPPKALTLPEEVCLRQPGSSPRLVNKVSVMKKCACARPHHEIDPS